MTPRKAVYRLFTGLYCGRYRDSPTGQNAPTGRANVQQRQAPKTAPAIGDDRQRGKAGQDDPLLPGAAGVNVEPTVREK